MSVVKWGQLNLLRIRHTFSPWIKIKNPWYRQKERRGNLFKRAG
jgi:hypothetical protein